MVATYYLLLPFATLVFNCPELQTFTLALSILLSLGRIGCFFAGCCHGERIPDEEVEKDRSGFYMLYPDSKQHINQTHQVSHSYAKPTVIIEAILQSILTLCCLFFPDQANFIYGLGSIFIILFSEYRASDSNRGESVKQAIVGCFLYLTVCYLKGITTGSQCYRLSNLGNFTLRTFFPYILGALMITFGLSNDLEVKKFSIFGVILAVSYLLSKAN